jgi:flagellar hook-basal body complex protein FliE
MKINQALSLLPNIQETTSTKTINQVLGDSTESFGDLLSKTIKDVNNLQNEAGNAMEKMVTGEATDLHDVMVAVEKARTSFDLLMELRNKTMDMYREVMRISV